MAEGDKPTSAFVLKHLPAIARLADASPTQTAFLVNTSQYNPSSLYASIGSDSCRLRSHALSPPGEARNQRNQSLAYHNIFKPAHAEHSNKKRLPLPALGSKWANGNTAGRHSVQKGSETWHDPHPDPPSMYLWRSRPCVPPVLAACHWTCPCAFAVAVSLSSWPPGPSGPAAAGWCISHAADTTRGTVCENPRRYTGIAIGMGW